MCAVSRVRRDVKVVTNRMLTHLEPLSSLFIPVDNMGGRTAKTSLMQMEQIAKRRVLIFPGGRSVPSYAQRIRDKKKWHPGFIKLASKLRRYRCCWHSGTQQPAFMPARWCPPTVSMLLLMQQMFRRRHSQLPIKIWPADSPASLV